MAFVKREPKRLPLFIVRDSVATADSPWSPNERLVAIVLASFMGREGRAWPSVARLAVDTGLSRRTVQRALARLCRPGGRFAELEGGSTRDGGRRNSEYRLTTSVTVTLVPASHGRGLKGPTRVTDDMRPASPTTRTGVTVAQSIDHELPIEETNQSAGDVSAWSLILPKLSASMPVHLAATYLRPLSGRLKNGALIVTAPGPEHLAWLRQNRARIETAATAAGVRVTAIRFERTVEVA